MPEIVDWSFRPDRFTIRATWLRGSEGLPSTESGVALSLPFVEFIGRLGEEDQPVLRLLLASVERVRLDTRPCCEGCADTAFKAYRRIESASRLSLLSLPAERDRARVSKVLIRAIVDPIREFHQFIRSSELPLLPIHHQAPWDAEAGLVCLDAIVTLSTHIRGVLSEMKALVDPEAPIAGRQLGAGAWPEQNYIRIRERTN